LDAADSGYKGLLVADRMRHVGSSFIIG
jgi:hypothetical protein